MDVLEETSFAVQAPNLEQIGLAEENETHEGSKLKPYSSTTAPTGNDPTGSHGCERTSLSLSCPRPLAEASEPNINDDSSHHTVSLTSHTTGLSPWSPPEDCGDKAGLTMMEPGGASALSGDCLLQQSPTCLGCFIETKDATEREPEAVLGSSREYDACPEACPVSDMAMQCMSSGDELGYSDQLLSDQLLSYPAHKAQGSVRRDEKSPVDSDSEDATAKSIYDSLLLDKCNGEEAFLANSSQDWGCFESFISESKIELLDLCSKNELSVNLFTEEDVGNYMFDDEDEDSTLGSDVCSLKIRYESFQDNVREKTNAIQEETQFSFFPSVAAKKEGEVVTGVAEGPQMKTGMVKVWPDGEKVDKTGGSFSEGMPSDSPESSYLFDLNNSTEDSGEYSDDSSCTGSSFTCQTKRKLSLLSRENFSYSSNPSYGLRSKRKVPYREDYLYDVDSIENEKNAEKRDKQADGLKKEEDDDWCPKKRRRSSRREPPVVIKYIIINRFKGDKHMLVKIGKIKTSETSVNLSKDVVHEYQRLAPLKDYWQQRRRETLEQLRLAAGDKNKLLNSCRRSLKSKRQYRIANRIQIQRIPAVEPLPSLRHYKTEVCATEEPVCSYTTTIITAATDCAARLDKGSFAGKSRSQEMEAMRLGNSTMKIRKFKSVARLGCKKMKDAQQGSDKIALDPVAPHHSLVTAAAVGPQICEGSTVDPPEEPSPSPACSSPSSTMSVRVDTALPVIPGGYLQTLLYSSDSPSNPGISYYPQEHSRRFSHEIQEESQFPNLQLAHSCVLSPPSESELQESPSNRMEPNFPPTWQSVADQLPFTSVIPPVVDITSAGYSSAMPLPVTDDMAVSGYSQVNVDDSGLLYDKAYVSEKLPDLQSDMLPSQISAEEEHKQLCTIALSADNGRLVSYDSVGSHSVTSGDYTSLSLQTCEKDGEEDGSGTFLDHCSPKLVIQQSTEEIAPLRESPDLLDISNFTPDKFRHSSLSEMSPPDTPNLSPQVVGAEMRQSQGKGGNFQETDLTLSVSPDGNWKCNVLQNPGAGAINNQQLQFDTYNCEDETGLIDKSISADTIECSTNAPKSKGKTNNKQTLGQGATNEQRKAKSPRVAKTERNKPPRQNSRSSKKVKTLLQAKAVQGANQPMLDLDRGGLAGRTEDWAVPGEHGGSWTDGSSYTPGDDDQREFEEPSNILSNIVSGMAEVQRFMRVSAEPLWDPVTGLCQPPEANSLKTKTLKILAATAPDFRKTAGYAACPGAGRGRKTSGRGAKNQAKFLPSNPFFPPLSLDCNMFNKSSLGIPGIGGPAHKKMYRHKTSAKFARDDNSTGKKDLSKNVVLMASYEKRR